MNGKSLRGSLLLLLTAMIWGVAFVAQRVGMEHMPPLAFNGIRMLLAGVLLLPVLLASDRRNPDHRPASPTARRRQRTAGLLCGSLLFAASTLQQIGLVYTSAGKAGFITALYVVLVPVAAWLFYRKNPGKAIWLSVVMAVIGLFLLCVPSGRLSLNQGDLLVLGCAVCFTGHILVVDHYSPSVDGIRLSCTQFFVCGALSMIISVMTEHMTWEGIRQALIPILYAGGLSGAVGYTLQIVAQRDTNPAVASLMMCMESVFSALSGALLLGETMTGRETAGCCIMFAAVVLAQLSPMLTKPSLFRRWLKSH